MHRLLRMTAALAVVLAAAANHAAATPIVSETFSYAPGELAGQAGGTGWSGAWSAVANKTEVVAPATPLQYDTGAWTLSGGTTALQVLGGPTQTNVVYRSLAAPQSGEVWMSFLARWESGTANQNDFLVLWFDNTTAGVHDGPNIGLKTNEGSAVPPAEGTGREDFVVRLKYGTNQDFAGSIAPPESDGGHLLVGHLYKAGTAAKYNVFEMWVDPDAENLVGDRNASRFVYAIDNTGAPTLNSFTMLGLESVNLSADDVFLIDELRLGTTMQDVLEGGTYPPPMVPEPLTMAGLALGIGGLARYIRTRRAST
jgi:hypothetical protein